jgi:hypothetical protein
MSKVSIVYGLTLYQYSLRLSLKLCNHLTKGNAAVKLTLSASRALLVLLAHQLQSIYHGTKDQSVTDFTGHQPVQRLQVIGDKELLYSLKAGSAPC